MIIGIGSDLVDIRRIEKALARHGRRFEARCFTAREREKADRRARGGTRAHVLANRFAAKEACAKALGTGFTYGVYWRDIGVVEDEIGRPFLELTGGALLRLRALAPKGAVPRMHLSLCDEASFAQAFVVIEAR